MTRLSVHSLDFAGPRPAPRRALVALVAVLAFAVVALASPALAKRGAEISIMDDQLLLGASQGKIDRDIRVFRRRLGVDRLRVSAFWNQIAPANMSQQKPAGFDGADPAEPRYNFAPLDRVVNAAAEQGLRVMVSISMPAPVWASADPSRENQLWKPRASEFADFSEAVARRYAPLVDHYGISNEPNQGVWLQPQSDQSGLVAPHLYRRLVQASYARIKAHDPEAVALVGELASSGREGRGAKVNIRPLRFLRAMTCRDKRYRPIRDGRCRSFSPVPADAIGHHPYQLLLAPTQRARHPDDAAISDGRRLVSVLDRLTRSGALQAGGDRRRLNVFYTEFGYQTNPPDPFAGVSLSKQRRYLQEAGLVVHRTPRVRSLNQFRLTDGDLTGSGASRFAEFQSGLMFRDRKRKPAYSVFAHPFVIRGSRFWGQVRRGFGRRSVRVEYRRRRGGRFRRVAQVLTNDRGYFSFRLPGRRPGQYRYSYTDPDGRSGIVRVRR